MQRVRDLGMLNPKWDILNKLFASGLKDLCGREGRKIRARVGDYLEGNSLPDKI